MEDRYQGDKHCKVFNLKPFNACVNVGRCARVCDVDACVKKAEKICRCGRNALCVEIEIKIELEGKCEPCDDVCIKKTVIFDNMPDCFDPCCLDIDICDLNWREFCGQVEICADVKVDFCK